jgi:hypothetical protein
VANFTTTGLSVKVGNIVQVSGTTSNDFSNPVTYTVYAADNSTQTYTVTVTIQPSTSKTLTAFSFANPLEYGTISGSNVSVTVPYGTVVKSLVATFASTGTSVKIGPTTQVSGTTANDFTNPVVYTVFAGDGSTQNYTVTVTVASSSSKSLTAFSLTSLSPPVVGTISGTNIGMTVPYGTDLTKLIATFATTGTSVSVGGTVQTSGTTSNDFTNPVTYTVTAADSTTQNYIVTVTEAKSPYKNITSFGFVTPNVTGSISGTSISLAVPSGTSLTSLVATFVTTGASVSVSGVVQTSGTTANNFSTPVTYVVTAADGSTQNYTVNVSFYYTITYHGNASTSGSPPVDTTHYAQGSVATLESAGTLTQSGYNLIAWNTQPDGSGLMFPILQSVVNPAPGTNPTQSITATMGIASANVDLYPFWVSSNIKVSASGQNLTVSGFVTTPAGVVTIPLGFTGIGQSAFLQDSQLTSISISTSVTTIGSNAFSGCTSLTSVTIPVNVSSIGAGAFLFDTNLTTISVDPANPNFQSISGIVYDKAGKTLILAPAGFSGSLTVPSGVTAINTEAFSGCANLTSVSLPTGLLTIGDQAFSSCGLTSITIPSSVTSLGIGAFEYNSGYGSGASFVSGPTTVTIPASVTQIGKDAFAYDLYLKSINVDSANTAYSSINGVLLDKTATTLIEFPSGVTGSYTVPAGVQSIATDAFIQSNLVSISLPSTLASINDSAFQYSSLSSITLPSGLTFIGMKVFEGCSSLTSVVLQATTPPSLVSQSQSFDSVGTGFLIHVPSGTLSTYQNAPGWSDYASAITSP